MTELQASAVAALEEYGTYSKAADALGISREALRDRVRAARRYARKGETSNPPIPDIAKPPEGFIINRHSSALDANGNLLRQWIGTRTDAGEVFEVPAGHVVKGESALVDPDGRVLAKWVKTKEGSGDGLIEALRGAFAGYEGRSQEIATPDYTDDDLLTIYPLADLHFGLYSWKPETGADYDTEIAESIARQSVCDLVSQSKPSKRAVLLGLGDYFHANDSTDATPGHKHRLDVDGRWARVYEAGARLACSMIDAIAAKHEQVEVVWLPGNHDQDAAVTLQVALRLFYQNSPRIDVARIAGVTWFMEFGNNLIGATHGHTMKPERMAMIMACDQPQAWGRTLYRSMMFGHIHHETAKEIGGVRVESFSTLAAKDAYAASSGHRAERAMSAITLHRVRGEIGRHRVNVS